MDLHTGPSLAALISLPGIGEKRALALADHYATWDALLGADAHDLTQILGPATAAKYLAHQPSEPPLPDLPAGIRVLSRLDAAYPTRLAAIPNAPLLLWVLGTLPPEDTLAVAVVGTRRPNRWGASVADTISTQVIETGHAHLSGLALGTDTLGHEAALAAGAPTWAVLGQGVDTVGAGDRGRLAQRILATGGGLLSEVPPGTPKLVHLLTKRNRIQAGLSDAVVIGQTGLAMPDKPAGTLHTARYALEQHRPLLVPRPHGPWANEQTAGSLALTDPTGCDPAVMHITDPTLAAAVHARTPFADVVITSREDSLHALTNLTRFIPVPASATPAVESPRAEPLW